MLNRHLTQRSQANSHSHFLFWNIVVMDPYPFCLQRHCQERKQIQLLGYSMLVVTSLFLCMYFGNPNVFALADLPIPSGEIINMTLSLGMLLLFVGHSLVARGSKETTTSS
jgi:hypothetical protein